MQHQPTGQPNTTSGPPQGDQQYPQVGQPPITNQGYYQYPPQQQGTYPQPYGQPYYPPQQPQGYYGQQYPPQQPQGHGMYHQYPPQPVYHQYSQQQQQYGQPQIPNQVHQYTAQQQPVVGQQIPPGYSPQIIPQQQGTYPQPYGQTPQYGGQPNQIPQQQYPPQSVVGQQGVTQPQGFYSPQQSIGQPNQIPQQQYPPQSVVGQPQQLLQTPPQRQAPLNLSYQKVATLGEEEDVGEFKFEYVNCMVVHQKRNWLFVPDWKFLHIFDLTTKRNLKTIDCSHLWGTGNHPSDVDLDYNDETIYISANSSLFKLTFDGDVVWKVDYHNREERGMKFHPNYIAVNQSDSSILCGTEGSGTQILQIMSKDGQGGKIVSEDAQGKSRYYCFNSLCYSGYGNIFYVGDSSTIYQIDSNGKILKTHKPDASPQSLRVDHNSGCLIMSDYHKRIRYVTMDGFSKNFVEEGGTQCCEVSDQLGELYVSFSKRIDIYKCSIDGSQVGPRPLPNVTQPLKVSPNRNMKRFAILGEEEDCGEFKFNSLIAMIVHQRKKHLLVAERKTIQIFDLTTKRHIKTIKVPVGDCDSIQHIDIDYNEDTIIVSSDVLVKMTYDGDIIWKVDYSNREQRGFKFMPRYIAVNQTDSSILCTTEGSGTQIIQMASKDGQGGKVISEDSQGKSRYYCFHSVCYSGVEDQFLIGDSQTLYLINSKGKILKKHSANAHTGSIRLDRATGNIMLNDYHKSVRLINMNGYDKILANDVSVQAMDIFDETGELYIGSYDQVTIYKSQ